MQLISEHPFSAALRARHFRMANGLNVILVRDASAPVFAYQTWFAVGSRHEKEGRTGIAHLFEHLMFNATASRGPGELDRMIELAGGDTNAATWVDWTYYRDNLPASELQLAVELESDRMANLVLGDKQVESEREVVANERRFRVEDDIDGFLAEEMYKNAFVAHPYHWPTIGWMQDIHAITIDDCRAFYRTYYAPNNATVVLVGDFEEERALGLLDKHYGPLPAATIPTEARVEEPAQTEERRLVFPRPTHADKLRLGYKAPPLGHVDYTRLEVLSEILCGGNSARLHRRLVIDAPLCVSVSAGLSPFRDPGLYEIGLNMQRGVSAKQGEAIVEAELRDAATGGISAEELTTAKTRLKTRLYRELRTVSGKAEALGHFHTTLGDYRLLFGVAEGYAKVTLDELREVTARYLVAAQRTVVCAVPDGSADDEDDDDDGDDDNGDGS